MTQTLALPRPRGSTANDRLKESFGPWTWGSIAVAAVLHFALLALFPRMQVADFSLRTTPITQLEIPQEVRIPPPPDEIRRPQVPVVNPNVMVDENLTIPPVTFDENPATQPAPPTGRGVDVSDEPAFTPYEVRPEMRDRAGFARQLQRRYPALLRDAGIGGTVVLWVFIDEEGGVRDTRVTRSSGYEQLDEAARAVVAGVSFTPARTRNQPIPVWIQIPVTFQTR